MLFSALTMSAASGVDWSTYSFLGDGAGGGKYTDKYKVSSAEGLTVVNIQLPGFTTEPSIYVTVPAGISDCNVSSTIQGAGIALHLSAFTAQETQVTINYAGGSCIFWVYYADGTTGNDVKSNIVGVVIYRGNPKEKFNDPDLPKQYCNGLAIGTKNVSTYWGGTSALSNVPASVKMSSYSTAHANGGYTVKKIWNNNGFNSLPMYTNSSKVDISKYNTSGWYLPVNNEWNYILANISDINALLTAAGADTINLSSSRSSAYWLPLAYSSNAITIYTDYYGTKAAYYYDWQYNTNRNVRPIFAF